MNTSWKEAETAYGYFLQQSRVDSVDFDSILVENDSLSLSYQQGSLDTFKKSRSQALGIRVIKDGKMGTSYTEDLSPESLKQVYFEALEAMELAKPVDYIDLVKPYEVPSLSELHEPGLKQIDIERKMNFAQELESLARGKDPRISGAPYNGYSEVDGRLAYFNSKEFFAWYPYNQCGAYVYALAKDGDDAQMAYHSMTSRSFEALSSEEIANLAAQKTLLRLGATVPKSGKRPTILLNDQAQTFFGWLGQMFSAQKVADKTTPLKSRKGEKIFSTQWKLVDDPFYHGAYNSRPFDGEGRQSQLTTLIQDGTVQSFLTDQRSAHLTGEPLTSSSSRGPFSSFGVSPSNLVVLPQQTHTFNQLVATYPEVLVVTSLKGHAGYNGVTGDFSIESEGDIYRNGERVGPLKNFLITGNLLEAFNRLEKFGDDQLMDSSATITPSLLFSEMSVAGKS